MFNIQFVFIIKHHVVRKRNQILEFKLFYKNIQPDCVYLVKQMQKTIVIRNYKCQGKKSQVAGDNGTILT